MHSSRSTARTAGLPSTPRGGRSSSRPRALDDYPSSNSMPREPMPRRHADDYAPSAPRSIRSQRSFASLPGRQSSLSEPAQHDDTYGRSGNDAYRRRNDSTKVASDMYTGRHDRNPPRTHSRHASRSTSVASSSVSESPSVFDRYPTRSNTSSSRTSWEDNEPKARSKSTSRRTPGRVGDDDDYEVGEQHAEGQVLDTNASGFGASFWNRITEAANTLTISVGQAWSSNVATYSGEVTPPGQESTLCQVMKSYYLDKARSPSDLPDWLFTAQERGATGSSRHADGGKDYPDRAARSDKNPRGRMEAHHGATPPIDRAVSRSSSEMANKPTTKANDRLRALRDAKRSQTIRSEPDERTGFDGSRSTRNANGMQYESERDADPSPRRPPPKMGLPGRPNAARY